MCDLLTSTYAMWAAWQRTRLAETSCRHTKTSWVVPTAMCMVGFSFVINPLVPNIAYAALQGAGFDSHMTQRMHLWIMAILYKPVECFPYTFVFFVCKSWDVQCAVPNISKDQSNLIFRVKQSKKKCLLGLQWQALWSHEMSGSTHPT